MVGPLSKIKTKDIELKVNDFSPLSSSNKQVAVVSNISTALSISNTDIEKLGSNISKEVGETTERIISKVGVGKFDELGKILVDVQSEVHKLDPTSIQKSGISGWIQRTFGDLKKEIIVRMNNADKVFTDLSAKITTHIAVQTDWIKDLESLYNENFTRYKNINELIEKGEAWKANIEQQLNVWPPISADDPDAAMKIQARRDAEAVLQRLKIKLDSFLRYKTITESNAPKIRSQQETARTTIMALKDVVEQTIPMVKAEFVLYLQSLDAQKSIEIVESAKSLANTTLVKSADSAKEAAISSSKALNGPAVSTETLMHMKNRMLETLTEVKRIEKEADESRIRDKTAIQESQKQYLNVITNQGAI